MSDKIAVSRRKSRVIRTTGASRVVVLDLRVDPHNWSFVRIVDTAKGNGGKLELLELRNCTQTNDDLLLTIAPFLGSLKTLSLWGCVQVTDRALAALAEHCPRLNNLTLAGCLQITDEGVARFADICTTLFTLDLSGCPKVTRSKRCNFVIHSSPLIDTLHAAHLCCSTPHNRAVLLSGQSHGKTQV